MGILFIFSNKSLSNIADITICFYTIKLGIATIVLDLDCRREK